MIEAPPPMTQPNGLTLYDDNFAATQEVFDTIMSDAENKKEWFKVKPAKMKHLRKSLQEIAPGRRGQDNSTNDDRSVAAAESRTGGYRYM